MISNKFKIKQTNPYQEIIARKKVALNIVFFFYLLNISRFYLIFPEF